MSLGLFNHLQLAIGNLLLASRHPSVRTDVSGVDAQTVIDRIVAISWVKPLLQSVGGLMFFGIILKFVWDKKNGRGGGGGAGGAMQVITGLAGVTLMFVPELVGTIGNFVIKVFISLGNFLTQGL